MFEGLYTIVLARFNMPWLGGGVASFPVPLLRPPPKNYRSRFQFIWNFFLCFQYKKHLSLNSNFTPCFTSIFIQLFFTTFNPYIFIQRQIRLGLFSKWDMLCTSLDCILCTVIIQDTAVPQRGASQVHGGHFDWYLCFYLGYSRQGAVTCCWLCSGNLFISDSLSTCTDRFWWH